MWRSAGLQAFAGGSPGFWFELGACTQEPTPFGGGQELRAFARPNEPAGSCPRALGSYAVSSEPVRPASIDRPHGPNVGAAQAAARIAVEPEAERPVARRGLLSRDSRACRCWSPSYAAYL